MDNSAAWIPKAGSKVSISLEFAKGLDGLKRYEEWGEEDGEWVNIITKAAEQGTLVDIVSIRPFIYRATSCDFYEPDPFLCIMFGAPICCEIMFHRDTGAFWMFDKDSASVFSTNECLTVQEAWNKRREFLIVGDELYAKADKLHDESSKLHSESRELRAKNNNMSYAESNKLRAESDKLRAESNMLYSKISKLYAEGELVFLNAVIAIHGDVEVKWGDNDVTVEGICYS
jgi:hypothetical protein